MFLIMAHHPMINFIVYQIFRLGYSKTFLKTILILVQTLFSCAQAIPFFLTRDLEPFGRGGAIVTAALKTHGLITAPGILPSLNQAPIVQH
jgi:hypothetical protein